MVKTVTVDFWDVLDLQAHHFDLYPILKAAGETAFEGRKKSRGTAQIDYLVEVAEHPHAISGTAALIRTEDWPEEIHLGTGALDPLSLATNKALAEEMNFRYDRQLQVLVTQRHRLFRTSRLVQLLQDITGSRFSIQPKLRQDAMQRFQSMSRIARVDLKFHGPINPAISGSAISVGQALDAVREEMQAVDVGLFMSMGHSKTQSLAARKVRQLISRFRGDDNTKSLVVSGNHGDSPAEAVDFINDRLVHSDQVPYTDKHLDRTRCQRLLADSIETHRGYLRQTRE